MQRILVTGANGQLAKSLKHEFALYPDLNTLFADRQTLDIANYNECLKQIKQLQPDYIINCASYTNVEEAEEHQAAADSANALGPQNLSQICKLIGLKIIHISTDYIFSGDDKTPYTEQDTPSPLNYYGQSKLEGEKNIIKSGCDYIIIRSGWLYSKYPKNFFTTIYSLAQQKKELNIVADQIGTPTYCPDIGKFIVNLLKNPSINNYFKNIYNFSNLGECSWFEFAKTIVEFAKLDCRVQPITTAQFPTKAKRPKYSILDKSKIINFLNYTPRTWQEALKECINEIQ
jgi:dTDP-4-dehydrorhamnose reductase